MNVLARMNDRVTDNAVTTPGLIRIAVINDNPMFRERMVRMLGGVAGIEVVGDGATAADALKVAQELAPDVMLLHLRLPEGSTEVTASIARVCPNVRTVILTASENDQDITSALQAGARGYIATSSSGREVVETVRAIVRGDSRTAPKLAPRLLIKNGELIKTIVNDNLHDLALGGK
jgi:two-component system, NarL family, nitrate/nitrite response regulator NarL